MAQQPTVGHGLLIHKVSRSHTTTRHSREDSSGRVISPSQRPLLNNTQHSHQTNIHASGGIRTYNLSRRATADQRLRPLGHRADNLLFLHHRHKHQGFVPSIRSVPRVTVALSNVSLVFLLCFFLVACSGMMSRGFGFVAFFASVKTSLVCIHLSCLVCM